MTRVNASRVIVDFGQDFCGGVNFTFPSAAPGTTVTVKFSQELLSDRSGVVFPARTGQTYSSTWTLAGDAALDAGIVQHEFIQGRFAQVDGNVDLSAENANAWVVQHPTGGSGRNPFESACSTSVPAADAFGSGAPAGAQLGAWRSSDSLLDTVFNFSAYTIIATSVDVNVDGQTRERDVDVVDALNTELGQFYVFGSGDWSVAQRTLSEMLTNDTGAWTQWLQVHTLRPHIGRFCLSPNLPLIISLALGNLARPPQRLQGKHRDGSS